MTKTAPHTSPRHRAGPREAEGQAQVVRRLAVGDWNQMIADQTIATLGGPSPGAPKGNKHALKNGRYTAEALAERQEFAALVP